MPGVATGHTASVASSVKVQGNGDQLSNASKLKVNGKPSLDDDALIMEESESDLDDLEAELSSLLEEDDEVEFAI